MRTRTNLMTLMTIAGSTPMRVATLTTAKKQSFSFAPAGARSRAPEFYYNTPPTNLSREKCEKNKKSFFPKMLDIFCGVCYTIIVKGARV
jgi:hypothetical protein